MAGGNLGDLWFQLGVRDNTSKQLNAILKSVQNLDGMINKLNKLIVDSDSKGKGAMKSGLSNALDYLNLLQKIGYKLKDLENLKSINNGIDTRRIDDAKKSLREFRDELIALQSGKTAGGVDSAFMTAYSKKYRNILTDIKEIEKAFNKENTLSVSKNNAARLNRELESTKNKLAEIYNLQSKGFRSGVTTTPLLSGANTLRGVKRRMETMLGDDKLLANESKVRALLSDIAYAYTKATGKVREYKMAAGETSSISRALGQQKVALSQIESILSNIDRLRGKSLEVGTDTTRLSAVRSEIERIKASIEGFTGKQLLNKGFGESLNELAVWRNKVNNVLKTQSEANQRAKTTASNEARNLESTESRLRSLSELISDVNKRIHGLNESIKQGGVVGADTSKAERAMSRLIEMRDKFNNADAGNKKQVADLVSEYKILKNEISNAKSAQDKLNTSIERTNKNNSNRLPAELEIARQRIQSVTKALNNLQEKRFTSKMLGLDVSDANAKIESLKRQLRELEHIKEMLSSGNVSGIGRIGSIGNGREVQAANNLASTYEKANREVQRGIELEQKRQQEIAQSAARARNDLAAAFAGANAEAKKMQSIVGDIKSLFLQGGIVFGAQQFFNSIVQTGGEIVQQHVALRSILGDVQKADKLFEQTQQLALQSPFKFGELNRDVKQLAAFGVEANDLYDTTKRLADIASGLGVDFGRLGLAFGQVKARSWLDGKELRQFAYAGLPLLQKITDLYNSEGKNGRTNYTNSDIKKMISNREVSFEDVQKVLWKLTDEGGQFYNMQFVLSETLLGKWNKLIDAWDIMLGRFAEGKNVVGGTFKFLIDSVTNLVLMIDKLSPALLAFGGMLALRKGAGAIAAKTGIASELTALRAAQQLELRRYMVEQNRLVLEGQITREQATQNIMTRGYLLADTQTKMNAMEKLAIEGKLSLLQMQKAVREGLISKELIRQLEIMGLISAKQSELITKEGTWARLRLGANQGMGKLGGFFTGWNLATFGVSIGMALYSGYKQFRDSIKQETDRINETAKTNFRNMSELLSEVSYKGSTGEVLQKQIDKMKDVLEQSGLYTESIKEQIARAQDLSEEYDILKKKVSDVKEASNIDKGEAQMYAEAKKATGAGFAGGSSWFGQWTGVGQDDIDENTNDVAENLAKLQIKMDKFGDSTKSSMEKVADSMLGAKAAGMTFEEKLYTLYKTGGNGAATWRSFVEKVSRGNGDMRESLENLEGDLRYFGANFKELTTDDIPKYLEYLAKRRNMSLDEFSKWCKAHPQKLETMLDQMLSTANEKVPDLVERLRRVALAILNIGETQPKSNKPKVWKNPLKEGTVERTTFNNLQKRGKLRGGKDGFWQKEMAEFISTLNHGSSGGWLDFGEAVRKKYQDVRNENDSARSAGQKEPFMRQQRMLEAIAGQNGIDLNVGKNKVTGNYGKGSQEDIELERLRKRVELYKKFYSELEKYRRIYGEEGAMIQMRSDKEFRNSVLSWGLSDPGTYGVSIEELMSHVPSSTQKRKEYKEGLLADIHAKNRSAEEERIKSENNQLSKQLNIISEQYETYKKIYELTGNRDGSSLLAFGYVQSGTYQEYLKDQMSWAVGDHNKRTGQNLSAEDVLNMNESDFNKNIGNESENASVIYKAWVEETKRIKKETIDLMASLIEKNATIAQQIEDENRKYERQLELIKGIEDPQMRDRARAGATKTHNENVAKLQFEQFKQESNWVTIFDDLDGVSTSTIDNMITKIDEFSRTTGLSVESIKQLRDALEKLKAEQIERNPLPYIFGGVRRGNAIGDYLAGKSGPQYMFGNGYVLTKEQSKKMGLKSGGSYTKNQLETEQKKAYTDSSKAVSELATKMQALNTVLDPVINLFKAMGEEDSILGQITGAASGAFSSAASTAGAVDTLGKMKGFEFLQNAGPYAAAASAALSIGGSLIKAFGADYSEYNKAKAQYENLASIWDSLISKKSEYMNIHWGTEAREASKEAQEMLKAEIEQTKIIAIKRLNAGASAGSHSIKRRMWDGSYNYNGRTWSGVADQISSKYGVQFNGMEDLLNMDADTLSKIKKEHIGLWSSMDSDFRDYLEKLIEYGEQADDMIEALTEKLTGNKFSDLVSSWGDAMATMANSSDNLVDHFEENLKKAILNSMIENIYGDKIKALLKKTQSYAENNDKIKDSKGNVISEYTASEYADIKGSTDDLAEQIEATREYLRKTYGWSDNSSSSSRNSVKSITEETGDLIASYLNSIRLDASVLRDISNKYYSGMSEIAKSQLTQLNMIAQYTQRNAEAAEKIETTVYELNSNFNRVINGTKQVHVK